MREFKTHCPKGHELTEGNLRHRGIKERSGRECLTCYRTNKRERWHRNRPADGAADNHLQNLRKRAKKAGLSLSKRGDTFTVARNGEEVLTGSLTAAEAYISSKFTAKRPGPARYEIPELWAPWIDLLATDMRAAKRTPGTIALRVGRLSAVARGCPGSDPLTITRTDLVNYMATHQSWTPEYAHSVRTTLRMFFGLLHDLEVRPNDPARRLPRIRIPRGVPRPCPDGAIQEALESVTDQRLALAIRLGAEAGLRRMEIASLRRDAVEGWPGNFYVHVRCGKGGHARVVPISDELASKLRASGNGSSVYIFSSGHGRHVTPEHLGKLIRNSLPEHWTAHTLRHRFATVAYQSSNDIRAVQELLGHQSPATTAIYTKVADESMRRAAAATRLTV